MHKNYLKLQLRRAFKIYPEILSVTLLTVISIALVCVVMLMTSMQSENRKKVSIGVVGNTEDPYISVGIEAIKNYDSSQYYLEVKELEEEAAIMALKNREISGYIYIPDGYIRNIYRGNNTPAKYVVLNSPEGFGSIISREVTKIASYVVTESQAGMYSMQSISDDFECKDRRKNVNKLMLSYVNVILSRNEIFETEELGLYDSLSTGGYYICGMLMLFMLLWGISCSKLFTHRKLSLSRMLYASGIDIPKQILCEYIPFLAICVLTLLLFAIPVGGILSFNDFGIRELVGGNVIGCMLFVIKILPAIILITMMQTAVYELISSNIGAVLAQFIISVGLGYICGCFYPNYFFPDIVQKIAYCLPTGIGFAYIREAMVSDFKFVTIIMNVLYVVVFASITVTLRKHRIEGDAK